MSGSSLTNFTLTRNPGDENLCYFKIPGSTLVSESSVRLLRFTQDGCFKSYVFGVLVSWIGAQW